MPAVGGGRVSAELSEEALARERGEVTSVTDLRRRRVNALTLVFGRAVSSAVTVALVACSLGCRAGQIFTVVVYYLAIGIVQFGTGVGVLTACDAAWVRGALSV